MGFFDRLSTGWALGMQCMRVIWNDKTLLLFPILSGASSVCFIAGIYFGVGPEKIAELIRSVGEYKQSGEIPTVAIALAFGLYFGLSFITVFFNVALVGCARISLEGRDSQLIDGLRVAFGRLFSITGWAFISGTVGLLLGGAEKERRGGRIIRSLLGTAWTVITYFVLPIIVVEKVNVFSSLGRSVQLIKRNWGEGLGAQFSLGWINFLLVLPAILCFYIFPKGENVPPAIYILFVVYIAFMVILTQAAKQVLTVVLYRYATAKEIPKGFDQEAIQSAFSE